MLSAAAMIAAGCRDAQPSNDTTTATPTASTSPTPSPSTTRSGAAEEENRMRIEITISGQRFSATLAKNAATRDLLAQVPVTVDMIDHGGVEKTGPLPSPLSLDGDAAEQIARINGSVTATIEAR